MKYFTNQQPFLKHQVWSTAQRPAWCDSSCVRKNPLHGTAKFLDLFSLSSIKIITSFKITRSPYDQDLEVWKVKLKGKVYKNHRNKQVLGNKIFTLETFKSEKLPEFFGWFTCSKPSRTPGWREWEMEWSEDGTGVLCVCVPQCAWVITASKGKKCINNRCDARGSLSDLSLCLNPLVVLKDEAQVLPLGEETSYSVPVSCHCFELFRVQREGGGWRDLHLAVCWHKSLVTVCLCRWYTGNLWISELFLTFNNQPMWSQETA